MHADHPSAQQLAATPNLHQKPCLLIKHSGGWQNDRCERWLRAQGGHIETVVCSKNSTLPDANNYAYVIIYGGQACVNDTDFRQCLRLEMQFIESALKNNIPCFGICLGAQLIAHVLGASVGPLPCGSSEFGYSHITPTVIGKSFMPQPCKMLQWHCDGFELPHDCELLATSELFVNQAFRYNRNTYGVQFHPEVTMEVLRIWHNRATQDNRISIDDIQARRQQNQYSQYANQSSEWLQHFMRLWVNTA